MSAFETLMSALHNAGEPVRVQQGKARTRGICHDGDSPDTVSIGIGRDKNVVIHCFKECSVEDFITPLGLSLPDLYDEPKKVNGNGLGSVVQSYAYADERGVTRYYIDRYVPKTFRPRMADGSTKFPRTVRILYHLPEVLEQAKAGGTIFVCEGEKDADNLTAKGAVATTMPGGVGMGWQSSYSESLVGAGEVVIIADRDEPGITHAQKVAASLAHYRIPHRIALPAVGKDVSDHLAAGLGYRALESLDGDQADPGDGDDEDNVPERRLILTPASRVRIRPVLWMWDTTPEGAPPTSHGRIPMCSLCIAAGGPGLGKSQFAAWMTARITRGELPGELYGKPRGVIYAASEDSWSYTIAPRLIAAGADMDRVFRVEVRDDGEPFARLTLPVDTALIGQAAEEYSIALLIADPLLSLIDKSINDYRAAEVRQALEPLVAAADKHRFTILGLAHFTKSGSADPLSRVAGSGAFGQLIRSLIAFAKQDADDGDDEYVMSLEKNNLGRVGLPSYSYTIQPVTVETDEGPSYVSRFVLGPETDTTVREVMRTETAPEGDRLESSETKTWLHAYLADMGGCAEVGELLRSAAKLQYSKTTIYRARKALKLVAQTSGFGKDKKSWWYLPEAAPKGDESRVPHAR